MLTSCSFPLSFLNLRTSPFSFSPSASPGKCKPVPLSTHQLPSSPILQGSTHRCGERAAHGRTKPAPLRDTSRLLQAPGWKQHRNAPHHPDSQLCFEVPVPCPPTAPYTSWAMPWGVCQGYQNPISGTQHRAGFRLTNTHPPWKLEGEIHSHVSYRKINHPPPQIQDSHSDSSTLTERQKAHLVINGQCKFHDRLLK